ncbi:MAG: 16S rRNA (cytosine(1402)-N(4))-methyltransferase RsmH [Clostridia bacterium]|nr:16S rRNA (cytosine(1402)-N(4))-methyltransferase RsmH [Clostridia bacterium]
MEFVHKSVLFDECMTALNVTPGGIYVDGTLGGGGHSHGICERLSGKGRLIGIDRDPEALKAASERLKDFKDITTYVHSNYSEITTVLEDLDIPGIDGALLDLGVSSYQIDNPERGFSYIKDAPLDMRMNPEDPISAYDIVNNYSKEDLIRILRDYGEERMAGKIASIIIKKREAKPIETTLELADIIKSAMPPAQRNGGSNPCKRTFQALRIEVNRELELLKDSLTAFFNALNPGGVLAVITFHSLEDRIVKNLFADLTAGCICSKDLPVCVCGNKSKGKLVFRKPLIASAAELEENIRSHSAKLRAIEKF